MYLTLLNSYLIGNMGDKLQTVDIEDCKVNKALLIASQLFILLVGILLFMIWCWIKND